MLFFKEWVAHVQLMVERTWDKQVLKYEFQQTDQVATIGDSLQWKAIMGFTAMTNTLLYNLRYPLRINQFIHPSILTLFSVPLPLCTESMNGTAKFY